MEQRTDNFVQPDVRSPINSSSLLARSCPDCYFVLVREDFSQLIDFTFTDAVGIDITEMTVNYPDQFLSCHFGRNPPSHQGKL